MFILLIIFLSFIIGLVLAIFVKNLGFKLGLEDIPSGRSSHEKITPRGGGIGIPLAVALVVLLFIKSLYLLLIFSLILSVFALFDDKFDLPVGIRFLLEIIVSFFIILFYRRNLLFFIKKNYGIFLLGCVIVTLILIITASTNFFNFMDGIDGIAGFEAIVSFGLLAYYYHFLKDNNSVFLISLAVIASSLGFLLLNFPGAKVFMGDVGSIFIGFLFISLVIISAENIKELIVLLSFQAVFYIDSVCTIFIRLYKKENIFKPHLKHLYQRLVHKAGWSHPKVTLYYGVVQLSIGVIAIILAEKLLVYICSMLFLTFIFYLMIRAKYNLID